MKPQIRRGIITARDARFEAGLCVSEARFIMDVFNRASPDDTVMRLRAYQFAVKACGYDALAKRLNN